MSKCQQCDTKLDSKWHFCPNCGKSDKPGLIHLTDEMIDKIFGRMIQASQEASSAPAAESRSGSYGSGVRAQVFEVIVRQAIAGAPWREICAGPMKVNGITEEEIDRELRRRRGDGPQSSGKPKVPPLPSEGGSHLAVSLPLASDLLAGYRAELFDLSQNSDFDLKVTREKLNRLSMNLEKLVVRIRQLEQNQQNIN